MPGLNLSGTANTDDYNVGRGRAYFATLDANGIPKGYRFLGNAPEMNVSVEAETLTHQSSTGGLRVTDKEVVISQTATLAVTLDEINFENVALFFSGSTASFDNSQAAAATPVDGTGNLVVDAVGRWYDIYQTAAGLPTSDSSGDRMYDIGTVTIAGAVEGVDFDVDHVMGRVFVRASTSVLTVGVSPFDLDVAQNSGADVAVDEVRALTQSAVVGAFKFIGENPAAGDRMVEMQFHKISLKAEGDFALISDEFTALALTGVAERNEAAGGASSPTLTIRYPDQAA